MSILRNLAPETRGLNPSNWAYLDGSIPPPGLAGISGSGRRIDVETSLQLTDAYACVSLIQDDVSQLPIDTFRKQDESRKPIDPPALLVEPDPEVEFWEWIARIVGSMSTAGNAYGYLYERDRRGYPQRCQILAPRDVQVCRNRTTGAREYKIHSATLGYDTLPSSDILHIPLTVMPGGLKGLSPIEQNARTLNLAIGTEEYGSRWFDDDASPSSVFESDQQVDDDVADKTLARWIASHGGRRRPAFLGGGLKWKPVQLAPDESQFLETRKLNTEQIARIWRIPPYMIGSISDTASQGGGQGIGAQRMGYVIHTLGPYLTRIERSLSSKKISPGGQYVKFNVSALLRGDTAERFACYAIARQWGWMSVNDIRALEDLPPIEGGDIYLQPLNMIEADEALKALMAGKSTGGGA